MSRMLPTLLLFTLHMFGLGTSDSWRLCAFPVAMISPEFPESEANGELDAPAFSVFNGISYISPASPRSVLRG